MKKTILLIIIISFLSTSKADIITIHNHTDENLYAATYYVDSESQLVDGPGLLPAWGTINLERGKRRLHVTHPLRLFSDRTLFFNSSKDTFKEKLDKRSLNKSFHINIGSIKGNNFHIIRCNEELIGYNKYDWLMKNYFSIPIAAFANKISTKMSTQTLKQIRASIVNNSDHNKEIAYVRKGKQLNKAEQKYRKDRKVIVQKALEKFLDKKIAGHAVPTIALLESGGGYRAMLSSIGFHVGLKKIGLMDAVTYMVGLSGSTWSIATWIEHQSSIDDFKKYVSQRIKHGLSQINKHEIKLIAQALSVKYGYKQEITLVDFFGSYLANILLAVHNDERHCKTLSAQSKKLETNGLPCPIYTCVRIDYNDNEEWYEFTPWEFGSLHTGYFIPSWAYGRKFFNGRSVDFAPEQSLGNVMGTCGSAFAASIERIYKEVKHEIPQVNVIGTCVDAILDLFGHHHFTASHIHNYMYALPNCSLRNYDILKFGDAGMECNIPFAPVSGQIPQRKADILIFMDASDDLTKKEFADVEKYARKHRLKYPKIDYENIDKKTVSIFKDESDPEVPLVIYFPRVVDPALLRQCIDKNEYSELTALLKDLDIEECVKNGYARTSNFCYQENETCQITALLEFNVRSTVQKVREAIAWKVQQMEMT